MNWTNKGPNKPKYVCMWEENEDFDKVWMKVVVIIKNSKKVKQSRYRPGVAQRVPGS